MFYAHFVLSKKGPLARIWLAAHWDKKLTRSQVFETNISSSVEAILEPKVKLALRTSGHLLLGVVRIHSRQAKYLLSDCNEAFVKIKMAFRPGADLADDSHRDNTALAAITLSDNIHDFESTLADINDMDPFGIAVNQSRPEDITMREEFGEPNLGRPDDDFGDSTFEDAVDRDFVGEALEEHNVDVEMTAITDELVQQDHHGHVIVHSPDSPSTTVASHHHHVFPEMPSSVGLDNNDSEFGDAMDYGDEESVENIEQMFQDSQVANVSESVSGAESRLIDSTIDQNNTIVDVLELPTVVEEDASMILNDPCLDSGLVPTIDIPEPVQQPVQLHQVPLQQQQQPQQPQQPQQQQQQQQQPPQPAQARQLPDFVLPPVDRSLRENRRAPKRKRKLLIDEHKSIPSDVMKMQMQDTSEITTRLDLAPPTRKLMLWKETGNVEALFTTPGRAIPSRILQKLFYRNMKTVSVPNDAPDGLPVIPGVKRVGGFLNLDDDGADEQQQQQQHELHPASINQIQNNNNRWNEATSLPPVAAGITESTATTGGGGGGGGGVHHRELSQISEEGAGSGNEMHVMMPEGACSSYSTSYDCWSAGHATPHRGGDDDEFDVGFHPLTPVPSSAVAVNPPHSITGSPRHHRQGSSEPDDSSSSRYMPPVVLPTNQLLSSALINKSSSINLPYSSALTNANGSTVAAAAAVATTTTGPPGPPGPLGPPLNLGLLHESTVAAYAADIDRIYYNINSNNNNNNNNVPSSTTSWYPGKSALDLTGTNLAHHQHQQQQLELSQLINKSASSSFGSAFTEMPSIERAREQRDSTLSSFGNFSDAVNESVLDRTINSGGVMEREEESATESLSNKLQTTMVMLDQQLDKVNEEYPVEITQEGLEKRSEIMLNVLRNAIKREGQVDFHHLTVSNNKKQAASKFYTLLLLGKQKKLQMFQATPDSNIIITSVLNE